MATTAKQRATRPARLLIADDHPVVRAGIRAMLNAPDMAVVGEAGTGADAVEQVATCDADVVLMDIRMPDMDGLDATAQIKRTHPTVAVIVLTSFDSPHLLRQAIAAGAAGYLLKGSSRELLLESVRAVREGGSLVDPALLRSLVTGHEADPSGSPSGLGSLSRRELEVLRRIALGHTNHEIAEALGYSVGTVKNAVQRVIQKLNVSDRTQAAVVATRAGLNLDADPTPQPR